MAEGAKGMAGNVMKGAKDAADKAGDKAENLAANAKDAAGKVVETAKDATDKATEKANDLAANAKDAVDDATGSDDSKS